MNRKMKKLMSGLPRFWKAMTLQLSANQAAPV